MNKSIKLLIASGVTILILGIIASSFIAGALFWRLRSSARPVLAGYISGDRTGLYNNQGNAAKSAGQVVSPDFQSSSPTPMVPVRPGGMMGMWGYGGRHGMMMGRYWNNTGVQTTPLPGSYGCCGMYGSGMMNGWGYSTGQNAVIPQPTPNASVSFKQDVLPIFEEDCKTCHGGTAGLYLDSYANLMRGGRSGAVIVPGNPQASLLIQYVAAGYMPFRQQPLTTAEIQTLVNWVAAGANDN